MEFRFRAGDPRASTFSSSGDGFFTEQALRASYASSDFERSDLLHEEAFRLQCEKERIREEIIAREILYRRMLVEEVRREMKLEQEIALRGMHYQRFLLPAASASPARIDGQRFPVPIRSSKMGGYERFRVENPSGRRIVLQRLVEARVGERFPFAPRFDEVDFETMPTRKSLKPVESKSKANIGVSKPKFVFSPNSKEHPDLTGTKRKERTAEISNETMRLAMSKKVKKEWFCDLCHVSTTCKVDLANHRRGKKHKKAEKLRANETGCMNSGTLTPIEKQADMPTLEETGEVTSGSSIDEGKKPRAIWCKYCNIKCFSEIVMASHCRGKKHLAMVQKMKEDIAVSQESWFKANETEEPRFSFFSQTVKGNEDAEKALTEGAVRK